MLNKNFHAKRRVQLNKFDWQENENIDPAAVARLVEEFKIPEAGARFLVSRSLTDSDAVEQYLHPGPGLTHDPFEFENMQAAVAVVQKTAADKRPVLIHGDYDVDGISGTALLYLYLGGVFEQVFRFLPDRRKDGYGMAERAVEWAIKEKVGLVIAVDCGTSDGELISKLNAEGIDVVVCDHHEFPPGGDSTGVMLNPVRSTEPYPFKSLCGAGVAYKLVQALHQSGVHGKYEPEELLDLMALATVGDMSPLIDENRYFVRAGLDLMNNAPRPGLGAIKEYSRIGAGGIDAGHISFVFAPRLNAPGRVSLAKPSLEILCAEDRGSARQLASVLEGENDRRKELTKQVNKEAVDRIRRMEDRDQRGAFVLAGEDWDEGVLGIAATRVVEEFRRPTILLSIKEVWPKDRDGVFQEYISRSIWTSLLTAW